MLEFVESLAVSDNLLYTQMCCCCKLVYSLFSFYFSQKTFCSFYRVMRTTTTKLLTSSQVINTSSKLMLYIEVCIIFFIFLNTNQVEKSSLGDLVYYVLLNGQLFSQVCLAIIHSHNQYRRQYHLNGGSDTVSKTLDVFFG